MVSLRSTIRLTMVLVALLGLSSGLPTPDKQRFINDLDLVDDDGSIETALINYLFTKQLVQRLHNRMDIGDLQRKRSYWRQCAFNAVSCFGK
ncbi:prohormone-1 [Orussus abietinus]|uniref:prohormone-1 n=1 Tax=Orussus abietinus TaxID=222816 RepID=UPI000626B79C|nr:prohormone-1 [Orussus abietinus]XP_012282569.1 prohormone-1 [Orussus abietinus]XP_012282570.1 prohormone-1 [Orussus abietinus]XP_012282571.1 prohormone-1 [Orussus abietinus]XP_023290126.1 prohormone-1 [Orussus abietinus]